jgi:putative restriction endonuclease
MSPAELSKKWLGKLTRLNPATGRGDCRGKAPHKPLLLLCLFDMAEAGEFPARAFARSPGLVLRFRSYGALVIDRWPTRLELKMPFFHLRTQGFWDALDAEMRHAGSPDTCAVCEMHPEFFELLADPGFRLKARVVLITKYFDPTERISLFESLGLRGGESRASSTGRVMEEAEEAAKRKGRSARFAVRVCSEYRYTCALTGYRCVTGDGATIVDAAHIEKWADTQNDDPANGLALSKNAHWMFDAGLWFRSQGSARHRQGSRLHRARPRSLSSRKFRRTPFAIRSDGKFATRRRNVSDSSAAAWVQRVIPLDRGVHLVPTVTLTGNSDALRPPFGYQGNCDWSRGVVSLRSVMALNPTPWLV